MRCRKLIIFFYILIMNSNVFYALKLPSQGRSILYVPENYLTIQAAVDSASQTDIISIAPGTYFENIYVYRKSLSLVSRGGAERTIIDGGKKDYILDVWPSGFFELKGLTFRNGKSSHRHFPGDGVSFAIAPEDTVLLIEDCIIEQNGDSLNSSALIIGNSVSMKFRSTIRRTIFRNNECYSLISGTDQPDDIVNFEDCKIYENKCNEILSSNRNWKGYMKNSIVKDNSTTTLELDLIENCKFINNAGYKWGRIDVSKIRNSEFRGNEMTILADTLENCLIIDNFTADNYACVHGTYYVVKNCIIFGNINKGGYYSGAGGVSFAGFDNRIENSIISGNECYTKQDCGGGIYVFPYSEADIINCTIDNNFTDPYYSSGAGVYLGNDSVVRIFNTIVTNNRNSYGISRDLNVKTNISYCDVWNNELGNYLLVDPGIGCISEDPLFSGGMPCNYHLLKSSPCIDSGIDKGVYSDIDGDLRPYGDGFDMGADEWTGTFFPIMKLKERN